MFMHPSCHGLCLIRVAYYFKGDLDKYKHSSQNKLWLMNDVQILSRVLLYAIGT